MRQISRTGHSCYISLLPQVLERLGPKQHAVDAFPPVQLDGMQEQRGKLYIYRDIKSIRDYVCMTDQGDKMDQPAKTHQVRL